MHSSETEEFILMSDEIFPPLKMLRPYQRFGIRAPQFQTLFAL